MAAAAAFGIASLTPFVAVPQEMDPIPTETGQIGVLTIKRNATESELRELAKTIADAKARAASLEASIADVEKTTSGLREALVASAARRKDLERQVIANEDRLTGLATKEKGVKASLHQRRGLLA